MSDLTFRSVTALTSAIKAHEIARPELLQNYLAQLGRHDPTLNAIIVTDLGGAHLRAAEAADAALASRRKLGCTA